MTVESDQENTENNTNPVNQEENKTPETPASDPYATLLTMITNENGEPRYGSVEKALSSIPHAQSHIKTLEEELRVEREKNKQLSTEAEKIKALEETIAQLTAAGQEQPAGNEQTPQTGVVTEDAVAEYVRKALEAQKTSEALDLNKRQVLTEVINTYGDKSAEFLKAKAEENGYTPEEFEQFIATKPKAALNLLKMGSTSPGVKPSTSSYKLPSQGTSNDEPLKPEKSIMYGVSQKEQMEWFRKSKEATNRRLGITS